MDGGRSHAVSKQLLSELDILNGPRIHSIKGHQVARKSAHAYTVRILNFVTRGEPESL